ncbi:MAG: NAD-dependent epimerase/dehydratase family protein [Ignavibacteriaceae bacterium]|nr:NAD-dependent epimerase/dehydratase family protein [Ignavibacteriaceae bacterium]
MKIFITGGTGFIGRHTMELLSKTNHQLNVLIRKTSDTSFITNENVTLVEGDLSEKHSLLKGMENCDAVINIAGHYTFWEPDKKIYSKINIDGTRNVLECALQSGVKKVVHISTAGIFGKPDDEPFNEASTPGQARFSEYFRTKYEGDRIAWDLYEKKGLPLVVIYPVAVLGPGDTKASGQYISDLIRRKLPATVFKNGIFTFVYVKDVAQAIVNALEKENNIGEKYLVGNSRYTWGEVNKMISEISGVRLPMINLPNSVTLLNAYLLTGLANIIKKPPLWGMAIDQMKVMNAGFNADGSKAERELGIKYTPIRFALQEAIDSFK